MAFSFKPHKYGFLQDRKLRREKKNKRTSGDLTVGETENIKKVWFLKEKEAYLEAPAGKRIPQLLLFLGVFVILSVMIFWVLPAMVEQFSQNQNPDAEDSLPVQIYGQDIVVVNKSYTNLLHEPVVGSLRISQILFNEPLQILDAVSSERYYFVSTMQDGLRGYVARDDVVTDTSSIEPNFHRYKIVVSDPVKRIMTHASRGTLHAEVMLFTTLYSDFKGDGVYRVTLPGGETGWIGSSGLIELSPQTTLEKVPVRYFVSSVESFHYATLIDHGLTQRGASVEGVVYVCANLNGLAMPRRMEMQFLEGDDVSLKYDPVTGDLDITIIRPGDLVFFRSPAESQSNEPYEMGICTDEGMILMNHTSRTMLRIRDISKNVDLKNRVIAIKRIFS